MKLHVFRRATLDTYFHRYATVDVGKDESIQDAIRRSLEICSNVNVNGVVLAQWANEKYPHEPSNILAFRVEASVERVEL